MFGFSIKEKDAKKLYDEGIQPLLHILTLRGAINHDKLPSAIWTDAYIQGFFMSLAMNLREFMRTEQLMSQPTAEDMAVIEELFESYICPDGHKEIKKSLENYKAGNISEGWNLDEYKLATNHAINVILLPHNKLAPEFHNAEEVILAKKLAKDNESLPYVSKGNHLTAMYLMILYLEHRIADLIK